MAWLSFNVLADAESILRPMPPTTASARRADAARGLSSPVISTDSLAIESSATVLHCLNMLAAGFLELGLMSRIGGTLF